MARRLRRSRRGRRGATPDGGPPLALAAVRIPGITSLLAGAPVATLVVLAVCQWADFWPAMIGIAVTILTAGAFALVWERDLDLLIDAVRRVASDASAPASEAE